MQVAEYGLRQTGGESLEHSHRYALGHCSLSDEEQLFEFSVTLNRGLDTTMEYSYKSNPVESADSMTDRAIDVIRTVVRSMLSQRDGVGQLEPNEYIEELSINRFEKVDDFAEESYSEYNIELSTDAYNNHIIVDERMNNFPRIAGRRVLVKDIWEVYNSHNLSIRDIPAEFDYVISEADAAAAIRYRESDNKVRAQN